MRETDTVLHTYRFETSSPIAGWAGRKTVIMNSKEVNDGLVFSVRLVAAYSGINPNTRPLLAAINFAPTTFLHTTNIHTEKQFVQILDTLQIPLLRVKLLGVEFRLFVFCFRI